MNIEKSTSTLQGTIMDSSDAEKQTFLVRHRRLVNLVMGTVVLASVGIYIDTLERKVRILEAQAAASLVSSPYVSHLSEIGCKRDEITPGGAVFLPSDTVKKEINLVKWKCPDFNIITVEAK